MAWPLAEGQGSPGQVTMTMFTSAEAEACLDGHGEERRFLPRRIDIPPSDYEDYQGWLHVHELTSRDPAIISLKQSPSDCQAPAPAKNASKYSDLSGLFRKFIGLRHKTPRNS